MKNGSNTAQCFNPAFIHSIAVPDADMLDKSRKICAVARGDGVVDVINIESELATMKSKSSSKARKGSQSTSKDGSSGVHMEILDQNGRNRLHLDYSVDGHIAAVSCVAFSLFGERGKFIISGGNDKSVKVWDCSRYLDAAQPGSNNEVLHHNFNLSRKVGFCIFPMITLFLAFCYFSLSRLGIFLSDFTFGRSIGSVLLQPTQKT